METKRVNGVTFKELSSTGFSAWSRGCDFSIVVSVAKGMKYKITHDSGNCYSHTKVYVMLPTLEWKQVASEFDISGCKIDYILDENVKLRRMAEVYDKVLAYIVDVFLS